MNQPTYNRRLAIALLGLPSVEVLACRLDTATASLAEANADENAKRNRLVACCNAVWNARKSVHAVRDAGLLVSQDLITKADEASLEASRVYRWACLLPR